MNNKPIEYAISGIVKAFESDYTDEQIDNMVNKYIASIPFAVESYRAYLLSLTAEEIDIQVRHFEISMRQSSEAYRKGLLRNRACHIEKNKLARAKKRWEKRAKKHLEKEVSRSDFFKGIGKTKW